MGSKAFEKRALFVCLLISIYLWSGHLPGQNRKTLGWIEAINQALSANQSLMSAQEDLLAKREDISIARANFFPQVTVLGSFTESRSETFSEDNGVIPSSTGLIGGGLSQMIFDETAFANYTIQKELVASEEEKLKNTRLSIISSAGKSYIGVLFAEDMLQAQITNRDLTEQNLEISRAREEVGATSLQEVLRWQSQLYSNEQDIAEQRSSVLASRFALNQMRNRPAEEHLELEKLNVKKDGFVFSGDIVSKAISDPEKTRKMRDYLVELALARSPVLSSLDRAITAQNRMLESNKRWLIPSFSFNAGASAFLYRKGEGADFIETDKGIWKFGVSMSWPIFEGGRNLAEVHQASAEVRALQAQRQETVSSLEQAVRSNTALVIADLQKLSLAESQLTTAKLNYDLVLESYLVGEIALLDLLDAQSEMLVANTSQIAAFYTFLIDLLSLQQSMGNFAFLESPSILQQTVNELERRIQAP